MLLLQAGRSIVTTALVGALASAGVAALVLSAGARPWRGRAVHAPAAGPPLAMAAGFLACYVVTHGWPRLAGASLRDELAWSGLAVAVASALYARRGGLPLLLQALVAGLLPWILLDFQRARHWGRVEGILWSAALGLALFLTWNLGGAHEARRARPGVVLGWSLATALASGAYLVSGSLQIAELAGGLAAALGACAALALWRRGAGLGASGVAPFALLYLGLTWCARYLSELSLPGFVLLVLAPLAALGARALETRRPRLAAGLELALPIALALAAVLVERALAAPPSPYG